MWLGSSVSPSSILASCLLVRPEQAAFYEGAAVGQVKLGALCPGDGRLGQDASSAAFPRETLWYMAASQGVTCNSCLSTPGGCLQLSGS